MLRSLPLLMLFISSFHFQGHAANWSGVRAGSSEYLCDHILDARNDLSLEELMDLLLHRSPLATVAGVRPMALPVVSGGGISRFSGSLAPASLQKLYWAVTAGELSSPQLEWIFLNTGGAAKSSFLVNPDVYVLNKSAISRLLLDNDVRAALSTLKVWKLDSFSADEVIEKFKRAAAYWASRDEIDTSSGTNRAKTYDFDVLAGILFGFNPADVLVYASSPRLGLPMLRLMFTYFQNDEFFLGNYSTFRRELTPRQLNDQKLARLAVAKFEAAKARGLSAIEIFKNWNQLEDSQ